MGQHRQTRDETGSNPGTQTFNLAENQKPFQINFMKYFIIALVFVFIGLAAIEQQIQSGIQKRSKIDRKVDSMLLAHSVERQILLNANDSLQKEVRFLALCVQYLDSVDRSKQTKSERAEKRGRFVGGIIKGIFPGL